MQSKFSKLAGNASTPGTSSLTFASRLGRDYIQNLSDSVPASPVSLAELNDLVGSMLNPEPQEFRDAVLPYLRHEAVDGRANPRGVKRFISVFLLNAIIKPGLEKDTMLALQRGGVATSIGGRTV